MRAFWQSFAGATGTDAAYAAWAFGGDDMPELAAELGLLVREGPKRATTSKLASFEEDGDPMPEVDEEFPWVEGEGDRSLQYWREAHIWFFEADGSPITDDDLVILERFDKVWPP